jgi:hypothetical protein
MIRVAITAKAFAAIAATMPLGSGAAERQTDDKGKRFIWLERHFVNKLRLLRGPGESYPDVILRPAAGGNRA